MVLELLIGRAADYVASYVFNTTADTAIAYALGFKNRKDLKDKLEQSMHDSVDKRNLNEATRAMIDRNDEDGEQFRNALIKSVYIRNEKEDNWFVDHPPCPEDKLDVIKEDVPLLVSDMRHAVWGNGEYRKLIGESKFQEIVIEELQKINKEMEDMKKDIEILKNGLLHVVAKPKDPTDKFIGRAQELAELDKAVSDYRIVFVTGFGGIGKSELCKRFSKDFSKRTGGKVVWVTYNETPSEGNDKMKSTIANGIEIVGYEDKSMDIDDRFDIRVKAISADKNVLLIIDNYEWNDDIKTIEGLDCHTLIITREIDRLEGFRKVEVRALPADEAYELLTSTSKNGAWISANCQQLKGKLVDVAYHTQTVALMNGLIANKILTSKDTVEGLFNFKGNRVYSRRRGETDTIMGHMEDLFRSSELGKDAVDVLRLACMLPASGMEYALFMSCTGADEEVVNRLYTTRWLEIGQSEDETIVSLHPMISELVWSGEHKPSMMHESVFGFLRSFKEYLDSLDYMESPIVLLPYSDIIVRFAEIAGDLETSKECAEDQLWMLIGYMEILSRMGSYKARPKMIEKCVELKDLAGLENLCDQAAVLRSIGYSYGDMGNYDAQLEYYLDSMALYERILQPDDPMLAALYNNIGYAYGKLEKHDQGLEYCLKALEIRRRILPSDHPDLAQSFNNVGYAYIKLEKYAEGLGYCLDALKSRERAVPKKEMDLALSYNNIGYT